MPVRKVSKGWQFGTVGKVYPNRQQAVKQGAAIKISQAKQKKK